MDDVLHHSLPSPFLPSFSPIFHVRLSLGSDISHSLFALSGLLRGYGDFKVTIHAYQLFLSSSHIVFWFSFGSQWGPTLYLYSRHISLLTHWFINLAVRMQFLGISAIHRSSYLSCLRAPCRGENERISLIDALTHVRSRAFSTLHFFRR